MARTKGGFTDNVNLGNPPPYSDSPAMMGGAVPGRSGSRYHPRNWSRKTWIIAGVAAVAIIVAIIVGAVVGSKENAYPDYSALSYSLQDTYEGTDFFSNFDFFTGYDPSSGFVHYVPNATATQLNLTYASSSSAVMRVDNSDSDPSSTGRYSVRVTSKTQYNDGLFIFDVVHSPYGCATWPALWTSDPSNWPTNGEIDVMEAVNQATSGNQMTLHTSNGCSMNVKRKESGTVLTKNCYNGTDDNAGCGVQGATDTFGSEFNANGGGVYAMEWRSAGIRIWFFSRSSIPSDITAGTSPNPASWGEAIADFPSTDCNIGNHFKNHSIIANIDLCGTWAGATSIYNTEDNCPGTCTNLVATNASAFDEAYWQFNSFKVYQAS